LFAQLFDLSSAERKTLLVAGACAGMTGIFATPVAAILLAVEALLFECKPRSLVPVAISSIVAIAWRSHLVGAWPLFPYTAVASVPWWGFAVCAGVGVIAGLQGALMSTSLYRVEDLYERLPMHWMWWPALGGIIVGLGGWLDPAVLGVGSDNIGALIDGSLTGSAAAALLVGKSIVWLAALGSGTSGGTLAPLLMIGGALGVLEAHFLPFGGGGFWALVAMCAVLGGTLRTALTATVFGVELTGNLHVMPALLTACAASFATTVLTMRRSPASRRLATACVTRVTRLSTVKGASSPWCLAPTCCAGPARARQAPIPSAIRPAPRISWSVSRTSSSGSSPGALRLERR
jgi:chloride channel protein, CIC family